MPDPPGDAVADAVGGEYASVDVATCTVPTADTTARLSMTSPAWSSMALLTITGSDSRSCCASLVPAPSKDTLLLVADCTSAQKNVGGSC